MPCKLPPPTQNSNLLSNPTDPKSNPLSNIQPIQHQLIDPTCPSLEIIQPDQPIPIHQRDTTCPTPNHLTSSDWLKEIGKRMRSYTHSGKRENCLVIRSPSWCQNSFALRFCLWVSEFSLALKIVSSRLVMSWARLSLNMVYLTVTPRKRVPSWVVFVHSQLSTRVQSSNLTRATWPTDIQLWHRVYSPRTFATTLGYQQLHLWVQLRMQNPRRRVVPAVLSFLSLLRQLHPTRMLSPRTRSHSRVSLPLQFGWEFVLSWLIYWSKAEDYFSCKIYIRRW